MTSSSLPLLLLLAAGSVACAPQPDIDAERDALLRLHEDQRAAHMDRKAARLTATFADTFFSIGRGTVSTPSRQESTDRFQAYFDQSSFHAWDDLAPPIIRLSPDGQMAYVIVQKRVTVTPRDSAGPIEDVAYAWLSTYEKRGGKWRLTALASTDRPAGR